MGNLFSCCSTREHPPEEVDGTPQADMMEEIEEIGFKNLDKSKQHSSKLDSIHSDNFDSESFSSQNYAESNPDCII